MAKYVDCYDHPRKARSGTNREDTGQGDEVWRGEDVTATQLHHVIDKIG